MGSVIPLPGVDPAQILDAPNPGGKTLIIRERDDWFLLQPEPHSRQSGWLDGWRFRTAAKARLHARNLCLQFPRLFRGIIDETGSTRSTAAAEMAGREARP